MILLFFYIHKMTDSIAMGRFKVPAAGIESLVTRERRHSMYSSRISCD